MWRWFACVVAVLVVGVAGEDAIYKSRTDLQPSRLNVTIYEKDKVSEEYLFLAPWSPGDIPQGQAHLGPHIFRSDGELVWSGSGYFGHSVSNFMPDTYNGKPVTTFFEGSVTDTGVGTGSFRLMNQDFETVAKVGLKQPFLHDFHEFQMTGSRTAAFSTYLSVPYNFTGVDNATDENRWVYDNIVTEIDVDTDEVLFQWRALDHVSVNDSKIKGTLVKDGKESSAPFDYMHLNSIAKDKLGNFLISCRHLWSLYYIDGSNGDVIWILGLSDGGSEWEIDENAEFGYQHHARWVEPELLNFEQEDNVRYISLFDNGLSGGEHTESLHDYSRGMIIKLDQSPNATQTEGKIGKVSLVQEFKPSDESELSSSQASAQVLSNGNVLIGWGSVPKVTEHTPDGAIVFEATINDGDYVSYRAFKGPFEGHPRDVPSIISVYDHTKDTTTCHISWNGATNVETWTLSGGTSADSLKQIESDISHNTFEQVYEYTGYLPYTKVDAVDKNGKILGTGSCQTYFQES